MNMLIVGTWSMRTRSGTPVGFLRMLIVPAAQPAFLQMLSKVFTTSAHSLYLEFGTRLTV